MSVSELPFLAGYTGQSTDELLALAGHYCAASIVLAFDDALHKKAQQLGLARMTNNEIVVLAVEAVEREVNNGGFDQFFFNDSRVHAPAIVEALVRIGCATTATIARDALVAAAIPDDTGRERALRRCDQRFFARADGDIAGALFAFIRAHRATIVVGAR